MCAEEGAYVCPGIPVQLGLDAAEARGYLCFVGTVGEGTGAALQG